MPGHDGAAAFRPVAVTVVVVDFELLADPEPGHWCDRCLLPSAAAVTGALTFDGVPQEIRTFVACLDCGTAVGG